MAASVEELYKCFDIINGKKGTEDEIETAFATLLTGVKGGQSEQRLASQFIARFFKQFPKHHDAAFNAMIDLLEDDNSIIRRQAIKDLPTICKNTDSLAQKTADILVQMLQTEDTQEQGAVQQSLVSLLEMDMLETLKGIFNQILADDAVDIVREKAVGFLCSKLKTIAESQLTPKVEEFVVEQSEKVLQGEVSEDEFLQFIQLLAGMKSMQTVTGRQKLVNLILEQSDLKSEFDPSDASSFARVRECGKQALPLLSKNVNSGEYAGFFVDNVLQKMDKIPEELDTEDGGKEAPRLDMLKVFAELSSHASPLLQMTDARMNILFNQLLRLMPLPPNEEQSSKLGDLKFSDVECLLFAFHQLGRLRPEFLTDNEKRLADFRRRLQYFARETQTYLKSLKETLKDKTKADLKDADNKLRVVALKLTNNVNMLIRELFKNPPSYKAQITLSWRPSVEVAGTKRDAGANGAVTSPKLAKKDERSTYRPPTGKFSEKAGRPPPGGDQPLEDWQGERYQAFRGYYPRRGRGRGGNRGRGGRWNYNKW